MAHLPEIIYDLALILMAAAGVSLMFRKIRQPVVLGYILAGFLVGPHFPLLPSVADKEGIQVWAEIGVIFLLFALGLEFSFKKLVRVGGAASITAVVEVFGMLGIGYATGKLFGWNQMDSLFLGGVLAISSTTIIIRALDELGIKSRGFVSLVFGVLVIEDLVAIVLMVLLATMAVSRTFSGMEMGAAVLKLVFFLTLWFLSGIFLLPSALKATRKLMSQESLLIVSLGLCFLMVVLATKAGFSAALGAFIMGSILAETPEGAKIDKLIHPVKDLFAAIFFVSVGMLIQPAALIENAVPVIVITLVTIFGKTLTTGLGSLLAGQSLKHSVQSGMSLAQIGEFSFIIASLGTSLKVTSDFLYPVAVAVSAITTFSTPYMIRASDPTFRALEKRFPRSWIAALERYSNATKSVSSVSAWNTLIRSYVLRTFINGILITAVFLLVSNFIQPLLENQLAPGPLVNILGLMISLVLSAPFVWALIFTGKRNNEARELWSERRNRAALFALELARWTVGAILLGFLSGQFVEFQTALVLTLAVPILLFFLLSRYLGRLYTWFEAKFVTNLRGEEEPDESHTIPLNPSLAPSLAPWDAHLAAFTLSPSSELIGNTLAEAKIRENFGVTIALIERGKRKIPAPGAEVTIYPSDRISVIGTDEQLAKFRMAVEVPQLEEELQTSVEYSLSSFQVKPGSPFAGKSIRHSGVRENFAGLVVGLERKGERILNPDSSFGIEPGDLLWIVGDNQRLRSLR